MTTHKICTMNCGPSRGDKRTAEERQAACTDCDVEEVPDKPARGYIEALEARKPVDMKGYVTDPDIVWKYPPIDMPPSGKLFLLNEGGVTTVGEWNWYGGFVAFRKLFKRDLLLEKAAVQYIKERQHAAHCMDRRQKPAGVDGGRGVERALPTGDADLQVQDT